MSQGTKRNSQEKKKTQIENKYFKCSTSLDISETIKTALRFHHACQSDEHQEDKRHTMLARMWEEESLFIAGASVSWYNHYGNQYGGFPQD